jgi:dihydrofolate reductase
MKLIVAINNLGVIGNEGTIPWKCKADMKHFKTLTTGTNPDAENVCIVGSNTYHNCLGGRSLPNRRMFVVGKNHLQLWDAVELATEHSWIADTWVIGGSVIYKQLLPLCKEIHISHINNDSPGDTYFEIPSDYRGKIFNYNFDED